MNLDNKTNTAWNRAKSCSCNKNDCVSNHKLCGICNKKMVYTAHVSNQPYSNYSWNIDHVKPKKSFDFGQIANFNENLQAVHVECNNKKN